MTPYRYKTAGQGCAACSGGFVVEQRWAADALESCHDWGVSTGRSGVSAFSSATE